MGSTSKSTESETEEAENEQSIGALAGKGVAIVFSRGLTVRAIGFAGTLIAARILGPKGMGAIAIGFSINAATTAFTDGGLGTGLIRRGAAPTKPELRAVLGFQLALGVVIALVTTAVGLAFGRVGQVTALMIWCVPAMSLRTPAVILAERDLSYSKLAKADIAQAVVSNGFAVVALVAGAGVWGVAVGVVLGSLTCGIMTMCSIEGGIVAPSLAIQPIREVLSFGVKLQASQIVGMARDQGLNIGLAAIGGTAVLGVWALASRLLQIPYLLLNALWRVTLPAMARIVNAGHDTKRTIESVIKLSSLSLALLVAPLGAASLKGVPLVFGTKWAETGKILPPVCLVLATTGPVSVGCAALLSVLGRVTSMLLVTIANAVTWLAISLGLAKSLGAMAVPIGFAAASSLESIGFSWIARSETGSRPGVAAIKSALPAMIGGGFGFGVSFAIPNQLAATVGSAAIAVVITIIAARLIEPTASAQLEARIRSTLNHRSLRNAH